MKRLLLCGIMSLLMITAAWSSVWAKGVELNLTAGVGLLAGDTTYQIGGLVVLPDGSAAEYHFPFSELEWPLDVYVASAHADVVLADLVNARFNITKNISRAAGWIKDSDWLDAPDSLDVYSESRTRLDAILWDATVDYICYHAPEASCMVGFGYLRQDFEYTADDIYQEYPSGAYTGPNEYPGRVFTYDMTYEVPYLDLAFTYRYKNLNGLLHFGWSPYASAEDEDHHLARDPVKVSKGKSESGVAYLVGMKSDFAVYKNWSLGFQFDYTKIDTDGYQKQWDGGVYSAKVDWKAFTDQMQTLFTVGYSF